MAEYFRRRTPTAPRAGVLILFAIGITSAQNVAPPAQASGYRLVFEDQFDSLDLSPNGSGNHVWYANVPWNHGALPFNSISTARSALTLTWRRGQDAADVSVTTTSPDALHFRAWQYGYFEARMRWDVVKGAWPAIWLVPIEGPSGQAASNGIEETGEIDIFEGGGDRPSIYGATIHRWINGHDVENTGSRNSFPVVAGTNFSDYHTYGLLWERGRLTWYFDNRPIHSERGYAIFDKEHYYLVLSLQVATNFKVGDLSGVTAQNISMDVDWVRVWQKPSAPN